MTSVPLNRKVLVNRLAEIERDLTELSKFQRLTLKEFTKGHHYERLAEMHLAFLYLGCAVICWRTLTQWL